MRSIMINKQNNSHQALYHEIIEHEGRKFRIIMDIHNGSRRSDTNLSIMLPNGTWGQVVNANTLNIMLESYIKSEYAELMDNCYNNRVRKTFIDYIKKVYA